MSRITQKNLQKQRQASAKSKLYSKQLKQTQKLAAQIKAGKFYIKQSQRQKSATMQFKSPKPYIQSRAKRSHGQFKSPRRKNAATQFKSPGPRAQSRAKRSRSQFKLPGPIVRSNIYAPPIHTIPTAPITKLERPQTITEQHTLPLPLKDETPILSTQVVTQSPDVSSPADETIDSTSTGIDNRLVWILAVACGLLMANDIYLRPLLADMGQSFAVSADRIGLTATLGQLGYLIGLIFIVPLGEKYSQRRLIVILLGAAAIALSEMAVAPKVSLLAIGSCAVGLTSIAPELIIPLAASLASPKERGRVVGTVLCGLFTGVPLAAVLGGFVGKYLGWRAMYWIAAGIMIALAIILHFALPNSPSAKKKVSYQQLLGSFWKLLRSEPVLQEVSILGVLVYGSFTAFWVTLSFILRDAPYHYTSEATGLFGLVGIAGALAALFVGRFADRRDVRHAVGAALVLTLLAFVAMWLVGQWLIGLIIGAILLDVAAQSHEAANETQICNLEPTASTRFYTIYMVFFCIGGSLGSALGTFSWSIAKHNGLYGTACLMLIVALGFYILHTKRIRQWRKRLDQ